MIILGTNSIKDTGYDVANSLRFNSGSSENLTKTPSSASNRKTFTFSFWFKRSKLGVTQTLFCAGVYNSTVFSQLYIDSSDKLFFQGYDNAGNQNASLNTSDMVFRDVSAWYHIVVEVDTTQATSSNRVKIYVNNSQITFGTNNYPSQNYDYAYNNNDVHKIGGRSSGNYFDGYMSEVTFIDGQQLDPTSFGEFDEDSGIWKPIDVSGLTFGNNGFYLEFKQAGTSQNSSGMGADTSGNDNHYAVNNLTAIDQMVDTPTNNYATFNPLIVGEPTATFLGYAEGNLQGSSAGGVSANTILLPTSGKWFVEYHFNNASASSDPGVGFWSIDTSQSHRWYQSSFKGLAWKYNDDVYLNGSNSFTAATFTSGDIISIAVDMDNNRVTFYKNGSAVNNLTNYSFDFTVSLGNFTVGIVDGRTASAGDANFDMNAGQNGTFNGRKTAGGNSDGDGYGNFSMSVPSGYYALNTKNLAEYG